MKNILLIEPNIALSRIYKEYLEKYNYQVITCRHSQEAINQIDNQQPDLIVLETQLMGHNGYEFLYELRSYPEWQEIPVIIHSLAPGYLFDINPFVRVELGIKEYLYKPACSLSKLLYSVEHHIFTS